MKKDIHPNYVDCDVSCSCGNKFTTRASVPAISTDICNACHPFFTGNDKIVDKAGRVERFKKRFGSWEQTESK
jgi:large subunit ribosomal protein L31